MTHPAFAEMKASREAKLDSMVGKRHAHHEQPSEKADRVALARGGAADDPNFTGQISDSDRLDAGAGSAGRGINGGNYDYNQPASSIVGNRSKPMGMSVPNPMFSKKNRDSD